MREALATLTGQVILLIDVVAMVVIVGGTIQAIVGMLKVTFTRATPHARRAVWIQYARWLIAGLTFQLAADLVHITIARGWEPLGRAVIIGVLRTFLSYFLGRDLREAKEGGEPHPKRVP